jgi:transcriptional regulator with XRE-family HTH domain
MRAAQIVPDEIAASLTAEHCYRARSSARLTVAELAVAANVHPNTVANFENGKRARIDTRAKLAEGLARSAGIDVLGRVMGAG